LIAISPNLSFNSFYESSPPQGPSRGTAGHVGVREHTPRSAAGAPRLGRRHSSFVGVWGRQPPSWCSGYSRSFPENLRSWAEDSQKCSRDLLRIFQKP